ncbi:MAG: hypothetical protein IE910_00685 [Brevundimonas sp.]|nr:hypothetical protein [Brevundimonas sp.]
MAITFPRPMPRRSLAVQKFELERVDYLSPTVGAGIGSVTAGAPVWAAEWSLTGMSEDQVEEWRAWLTSLRGSQRPFFGADQRRSVPRAYKETGLPAGFSGDASAWSVNADRDVVTPTLPAGFVLMTGDYIGFRWGANGRTKVRLLEGRVGTGPVTVEPAVPTVVPSNAIAYVLNPVCVMKLTPDTEFGAMGVDGQMAGKISAIQDLRA